MPLENLGEAKRILISLSSNVMRSKLVNEINENEVISYSKSLVQKT